MNRTVFDRDRSPSDCALTFAWLVERLTDHLAPGVMGHAALFGAVERLAGGLSKLHARLPAGPELEELAEILPRLLRAHAPALQSVAPHAAVAAIASLLDEKASRLVEIPELAAITEDDLLPAIGTLQRVAGDVPVEHQRAFLQTLRREQKRMDCPSDNETTTILDVTQVDGSSDSWHDAAGYLAAGVEYWITQAERLRNTMPGRAADEVTAVIEAFLRPGERALRAMAKQGGDLGGSPHARGRSRGRPERPLRHRDPGTDRDAGGGRSLERAAAPATTIGSRGLPADVS